MKILFCGGGTAGHITPNIAICKYLKSDKANDLTSGQDMSLYYVGGTERDRALVAPFVADGIIEEYRQIDACKLKRSLSSDNLLLPFRLVASIKQADKILRELRPDVVFSKGGYVGLPVVIAAHKEKIRTLFHESDMSLGLANKLCMHFADAKLSTFPIDDKTVAVGLPVRPELTIGNRKRGLAKMGFDGSKPILFVIGGSLGAASLNKAVVANESLAKKFDIFMLTGKGKRVECDYVKQAEYVDNPSDFFAATDVCLTRAGSTTLCELTLCGVPFVAVPLQNGSRGEQKQNAEYFARHGCGIVVGDNEIVSALSEAIDNVYMRRKEIVSCQQKLSAKIDGTKRCAELILGCGCKK